jgi:hypothetical protein
MTRSIVDDFDMISMYRNGGSGVEPEASDMRLSAQVELQFMMLMAKVSLRELRLKAGTEIQRLVAKVHAIAQDISPASELRDPQCRHSESEQRSSEILKTLDEIQIALCKLEDQTQLHPSCVSNESVSRRSCPKCGE